MKSWVWDVNVICLCDICLICLLGGKVFVYGGMFDWVCLNDDEFGVLFVYGIVYVLCEYVCSNFSVIL